MSEGYEGYDNDAYNECPQPSEHNEPAQPDQPPVSHPDDRREHANPRTLMHAKRNQSAPAVPVSPAPAADDHYTTDAPVFRFEEIHPDPIIARDVVIETLLGALSEARAGLGRAADYVAVNPNGIRVKETVRWAIEQTSAATIEKRLYEE